MKSLSAVLVLIVALGLAAYLFHKWRSTPLRLSSEPFAAYLESHFPRTSVPPYGSFYFNNGIWWQENSIISTPKGKPIKLLLDPASSAGNSAPDREQVAFVAQIERHLPELWPDIERSFRDYLQEMDDEGRFEDSYEWEISTSADANAGEREWTISFKIPQGHAAWYQRTYRGFEPNVTCATY